MTAGISLFRRLITSCAVLVFVVTASSWAGRLNGTQGEDFSDSSYQAEMPADWTKKPVVYQDWAKDADIALSLDRHIYPAFLPFIEQYAKEHGINIKVNQGTCGVSSRMISAKQVDIAGFCCPPGKLDRKPGLKFHTLGIGALTLIVHPDNPVDNITLDQALKLYRGKIYRWSELTTAEGQKAPDQPIQAIARLHCKKRPGQWRSLLRSEDLFGLEINNVGSIEDVILQVASNPWAIGGTESLYMVHNKVKLERKVKALTIDDLSPGNSDHLLTGRYPIFATFTITTWENEESKNPRVQGLIDYLLEHDSEADSEFHFVPASRLKKTGWKFKENELIGRPE